MQYHYCRGDKYEDHLFQILEENSYMNRILQPLLVSLLSISSIFLPLSLPASTLVDANSTGLANSSPNLTQSVTTSAAAKPPSTFSFTLQHRFKNGNLLPKEKIAIPFDKVSQQPWVLLEAIKQNFSKHLEKQPKPVQLDTEIEFLLSTELTKIFGTLPKLSIQTRVDDNGTGASQLVIPADKRKITKANKIEQTSVDWKGLNGLLTFTNQFQAINSQFDFGGLKVTTNQGSSFSWDATTFQGLFDADLRPSQLDLKLPLLKIQQDDNNYALLQTLGFQFDSETTLQGLELGNIKLNIGHLGFTEENSKFSLDNLQITSNAQEQDQLINYGVHTQIGNLSLPNTWLNQELGINYLSNLVFRRLDANALLALQKTARDMKGQNNPTVIGIALFAKLMEVAPKLLAQSPEMALTQFVLKTSQGNLEGNLNLRIDGNKATSLEPAVLMPALQAQSKFTLSKNLFEQLLMSSWLINLREQVEKSNNNKEITESVLADIKKQARAKTQQQIQKFLEQKWLVKTKEGNYRFVAQLQDNKLMVNGQEKPFSLTPNKP